MNDRSEAADSLRSHLDNPSSARVYDYLLAGNGPNNYAIDRLFADRQMEVMPYGKPAMRENRRFIGRAVEAALAEGIRQFVDIGSGLPSQGQAHEIADRVAPEAKARVIYIDNEPIANAHSEILLSDEADPERHRALLGDFFDYAELWSRVTDTGLIDPDEPTCLLITAILHFMPPSTRPEVPLRYYRDALAPGSMLVLTHALDEPGDEALQHVARQYSKTPTPAHLRTDDEIRELFGDWTMLEPGLTWTGLWRPKQDRSQEPWWDEDVWGKPEGEPWWGDHEALMLYRAGVARKPA
ncbi:MAG TPA: SAM-dependent methyltransferase [Amycolatopsis sp.]|nr:SAM-dependent methyltransferase [Amycolatopsis sp.]